MKVPTKVTDIIIVTHNNWSYTKLFLDNLRKYTSLPYKIICVDNCSADETKEEIRKYPEVKLIAQTENLGYGKAVNSGLAKVTSDNFVLLNNDIVVSPYWLENWLKIFENNPDYWQLTTNSNCIIDPKDQFMGVDHDGWEKYKEENKDKSPEELFKGYYPDYEKFCTGLKEKFQETIEEIKAPKGFLGGWAILMKKDTISKIGGYLYDKRFPYGFYEDVDLSWRIGLAGGKVGIARGVYIHHFINTTFDKLNKDKHLLARHNKWRFIDKWENYIVGQYQRETGGDLDKLNEILENNPGQQSIVEYLGMKKVLGIKNYTKTEV